MKFDARTRYPVRLDLGLPFAEAIKALAARKVTLPSEFYGAIADKARRMAFTVSNLSSLEQVSAVLASLQDAMRTGVSMEQWISTALATDWQLPPGQLETVFRTNVQSAYMSGHWNNFQNNVLTHGYLMYSAIDDSRVRPSHLAMSGYIAQVGDTVWNSWTPPCGFNCRCSLIALTKSQADARGFGKQQLPDVKPDAGFGHHPTMATQALNEHLNQQLEGTLGDVRQAVVEAQTTSMPPQLAAELQDALASDFTRFARRIADDPSFEEAGLDNELGVAVVAYVESYTPKVNQFLSGDYRAADMSAMVSALERALVIHDELAGDASIVALMERVRTNLEGVQASEEMLRGFKALHDGMTPQEWVAAHDPIYAEILAAHRNRKHFSIET